jgi:hypothetical protein
MLADNLMGLPDDEDNLMELPDDKEDKVSPPSDEVLMTVDDEDTAGDMDSLVMELDEDSSVLMQYDEDDIADVVMEVDEDETTSVLFDLREDPTAILLDFDEDVVESEDDVEEDVQQSIRPGLDITPKESARKFYVEYNRVLETLNKLSEGTASSRDLARDISEKLFNTVDLSFLTYKQRATLIMYVTAMGTPKEILSTFFRGEKNLSLRHRLHLEKAVIQLIAEYKGIVQRNKTLTGITESLSKQLVARHADILREDISFMLKCAKESEDAIPTVYVDKVFTFSNKIEYVCGNCGELQSDNRDFVRMLIHDSLGSPKKHVQVFPSAKVCASCEHANILTYDEHDRISLIYNIRYDQLLSDWVAKSRPKLSISTNIITYIPAKDEFPKCLNYLYSESFEVEEDEAEEQGEDNRSLLNSWYESTLGLIKQLTPSESSNRNAVRHFKGELGIDSGVVYNAMETLGRMYCNVFNENYEVLRRNAVRTVISFIKDNPAMVQSLSLEKEYNLELLLKYREYMAMPLDSDYNDIYELMCPLLGVKFEGLDTDGVYDQEKRNQVNLELEKAFEDIELELEQFRKARSKAIASLKLISQLYRFMPIKQISIDDLEEVRGVVADPEVTSWIMETSALMVINKVAPKVLEYWKVHKIDPYGSATQGFKNKSMFNERTKKMFSELVETMLKRYQAVYRQMGATSPLPFIEEFFSMGVQDLSILGNLHDVRRALETRDYYTLCYSMRGLKETFHPRARAFRWFKEFLNKYGEESDRFIEENGTDTITKFYLYHYSDLFDREEIEAGCAELTVRVKKYYRLRKLEDETFLQYVSRLEASEYDSKEAIRSADGQRFTDVYAYVPSILGMIEMITTLSSQSAPYTHVMFANDLVLNSTLFGGKFMYSFLGLPPAPGYMAEASFDYDLGSQSKEEFKASFILSNVIYPSAEFNIIASGGGSEDSESIQSLLMTDPDQVLDQLGHLEGLREFVHEHYLSGSK